MRNVLYILKNNQNEKSIIFKYLLAYEKNYISPIVCLHIHKSSMIKAREKINIYEDLYSTKNFEIVTFYLKNNKSFIFRIQIQSKIKKINIKLCVFIINSDKLKMEFPTNISKYLKVNQEGFIICTGKTLTKLIQPNFLNQGMKMINEILNQLGANSAKSQGLKQIITSAIKFNSSDHRLYLKVQGNKAIGFLRTGQKKLFYHDNLGKMKEIDPTCVLDIYVHESYQRSGIGKQIFQTFLKYQNKRPEKIAYDRPSPKLFGFLKKHYGLSKFIPQNNNFVIFDQFFMSLPDNSKIEEKKNPDDGLKKSLNRFYKHQNKPQTMMQQMPLVQTKQLNKTIGIVPSGMKNEKNLEQPRKEEKMEDSLSLLEKQINRLHLKTPPVISSGKDVAQGKQSFQTLQTGMVGSKVQQSKINSYMNYAPWATNNNLIFRTTSNSYGSYYKK